MRKFRKQLDEKTRMLQADIKKHQDALEMINRQAASGNAVIQVSGKRQPVPCKWQEGEEKGTLIIFEELVCRAC